MADGFWGGVGEAWRGMRDEFRRQDPYTAAKVTSLPSEQPKFSGPARTRKPPKRVMTNEDWFTNQEHGMPAMTFERALDVPREERERRAFAQGKWREEDLIARAPLDQMPHFAQFPERAFGAPGLPGWQVKPSDEVLAAVERDQPYRGERAAPKPSKKEEPDEQSVGDQGADLWAEAYALGLNGVPEVEAAEEFRRKGYDFAAIRSAYQSGRDEYDRVPDEDYQGF